MLPWGEGGPVGEPNARGDSWRSSSPSGSSLPRPKPSSSCEKARERWAPSPVLGRTRRHARHARRVCVAGHAPGVRGRPCARRAWPAMRPACVAAWGRRTAYSSRGTGGGSDEVGDEYDCSPAEPPPPAASQTPRKCSSVCGCCCCCCCECGGGGGCGSGPPAAA
eukprot:4501952-Prymnesium_polylepis.1